MAITALSGFEPQWYYPELDGIADDAEQPPEDELTGFLLKPLSGVEYMELMQLSRVIDNQILLNTHGVKVALRYGLVGWKNFKDAAGSEVEFTAENALQVINAVLLAKLGNKIMDMSELTADQKKT